MVALLATLVVGSLLPDVSFKSVDGLTSSLALFRGQYVVLVSGLDPHVGDDLAAIRALGEMNIESKPVRVVVLSTREALGAAPRLQYVYEAEQAGFQALGVWGAGKPSRAALYANPAGRLVRAWYGYDPKTLPTEVFGWIDGTSLPIGYIPPDPRPFLYEGGWLGDRAVDQSGDPMPFARPAGERGLLLLFLATRGPVDALYLERIREVAQACKEASVSVLGLFPAYDESPEGVAAWARGGGLDFACSLDPGAIFADAYRATRTPEAFLMDSKGKVVYTGAIDSSSWDRETNQRYLADAVRALVAGKAARPEKTMPFGTVIRRSKADEREQTGGGEAFARSAIATSGH